MMICGGRADSNQPDFDLQDRIAALSVANGFDLEKGSFGRRFIPPDLPYQLAPTNRHASGITVNTVISKRFAKCR